MSKSTELTNIRYRNISGNREAGEGRELFATICYNNSTSFAENIAINSDLTFKKYFKAFLIILRRILTESEFNNFMNNFRNTENIKRGLCSSITFKINHYRPKFEMIKNVYPWEGASNFEQKFFNKLDIYNAACDKIRKVDRIRSRAYLCANRERNSLRCKAYHYRNRDKLLARMKANYAKNREIRIKDRKIYYAEHRKEILEKAKIYATNNREKIALRKKAYYTANREKILAQKREYTQTHREEIKARNQRYYAVKKQNNVKKQEIAPPIGAALR